MTKCVICQNWKTKTKNFKGRFYCLKCANKIFNIIKTDIIIKCPFCKNITSYNSIKEIPTKCVICNANIYFNFKGNHTFYIRRGKEDIIKQFKKAKEINKLNKIMELEL